MQKTSQFETQCKGDISHVFETAKITVFYPTVGKTLERPYKTSCCAEHLILLVRLHLFYANFYATLYDSQLRINYSNDLAACSNWGKRERTLLSGHR